jgi:hypothetical protein
MLLRDTPNYLCMLFAVDDMAFYIGCGYFYVALLAYLGIFSVVFPHFPIDAISFTLINHNVNFQLDYYSLSIVLLFLVSYHLYVIAKESINDSIDADEMFMIWSIHCSFAISLIFFTSDLIVFSNVFILIAIIITFIFNHNSDFMSHTHCPAYTLTNFYIMCLIYIIFIFNIITAISIYYSGIFAKSFIVILIILGVTTLGFFVDSILFSKHIHSLPVLIWFVITNQLQQFDIYISIGFSTFCIVILLYFIKDIYKYIYSSFNVFFFVFLGINVYLFYIKSILITIIFYGSSIFLILLSACIYKCRKRTKRHHRTKEYNVVTAATTNAELELETNKTPPPKIELKKPEFDKSNDYKLNEEQLKLISEEEFDIDSL